MDAGYHAKGDAYTLDDLNNIAKDAGFSGARGRLLKADTTNARVCWKSEHLVQRPVTYATDSCE